MDKMVKLKKFRVGKFPYRYKCTHCNHPETKMEHDKQTERFLKESFGVESDLPLFFECVHCENGVIKPIGYVGTPSLLVECDKDEDLGDDFLNFQNFLDF